MPEYSINVCMDSEFAKTLHSALVRCIELDDYGLLDDEQYDALSDFCGTLGDKLIRGDSDVI